MRDGTAQPVSRDQVPRHVRGQENIHFPCSADHEQDLQPYPVDPYLVYFAICDNHIFSCSADHEQDWQPYPVDPYPAICDDHTYYPYLRGSY